MLAMSSLVRREEGRGCGIVPMQNALERVFLGFAPKIGDDAGEEGVALLSKLGQWRCADKSRRRKILRRTSLAFPAEKSVAVCRSFFLPPSLPRASKRASIALWFRGRKSCAAATLPAIQLMLWIAGKSFIAAIAAQGDFDVPAGQLADEHGRQSRFVGGRFAVMPDNFGQQFEQIRASH